MVDLKDRINKPRSLRGTPSYSYINKVSTVGVVVASVIGLGYALFWWRSKLIREGYPEGTLVQVQRQRQEEAVQAYVSNQKRILELTKKEEEEDEMYQVGM